MLYRDECVWCAYCVYKPFCRLSAECPWLKRRIILFFKFHIVCYIPIVKLGVISGIVWVEEPFWHWTRKLYLDSAAFRRLTEERLKMPKNVRAWFCTTLPGWRILAIIVPLTDDNEIIYVGYELFVWQRMCKSLNHTVKLPLHKFFQKFYFAIVSWMNFSFPHPAYDETLIWQCTHCWSKQECVR